MPDNKFINKSALRRQAEKLLASQGDELCNLELDKVRAIFQELRIHQIELELQNEELRRIQIQLEKSRKRFSQLYNNAPIGFLTLDHNGLIFQSNHTFMEMIQADGDDIIRKPLVDFVHLEDKSSFLGRYRAFFKQPDGKVLECRLVRKDGSFLFARLKGRLEEIDGNGLACDKQRVLLIVVSDITDGRQAQMDLEAQAHFLESLLASIPSPVFYKNQEGRYLGCNAAFEELAGRPKEQIVGRTVFEVWPESLSTVYSEKDEELLKAPGKQKYEHVVVDARGEPRNMVFYKSSFTDPNREVAGIVGVILDITERKKAGEKLRRKSDINAAMAELAETLLSRASIENTSFLILKKAQELTNSPHGFVGYMERDTGHLISPTLSREVWPDCDVEGKAYFFEKFRGLWGWVLKNGEAILTNSPQKDPRSEGVPEGHIPIERFLSVPVMFQGRVVGIIALANSGEDYGESDLSVAKRLASLFGLAIQRMMAEEDLLQAKEAAEAANVTKNNFLATMSHEIRTPMNAIIGFTDMTIDSDLSPTQRENLEIVTSSAKHLMNLLNDILDLSKIEASHIELNNKEFDLPDMVGETSRMLAIPAKNKEILFTYILAPDLPPLVIGDRHRVYQVLFNLIGNAIKFTHEGKVTVRVDSEKAIDNLVEVHFLVEDTGIGIPPEKQLEVFEPFTQADTSITRQYGGTGLGLTISRNLVEAMGGAIWVESDVSKGSNFHFTVPFKTPDADESADRADEPRDIRLPEPPKQAEILAVLLVEDNPVNQKLASALLEKKGCKVLLAEDSFKAIELYKLEKIDLILMDIEMPGMNGLEAAQVIRSLEADTDRYTPIIAMTAHAMKGDRERFLGAGMDDYLSKPITPAILYETIDRYRTALADNNFTREK